MARIDNLTVTITHELSDDAKEIVAGMVRAEVERLMAGYRKITKTEADEIERVANLGRD